MALLQTLQPRIEPALLFIKQAIEQDDGRLPLVLLFILAVPQRPSGRPLFLAADAWLGDVKLDSFPLSAVDVIKSGCGTGDRKVARTRRLESLRYVAWTFLSAGSGDFPVPSSSTHCLAHF